MTADLESRAEGTRAATYGRRPFGPISLAFATFILIGAVDGAVGVLLPSIGGHYALSKATLGLIFPANAAGYLCAAFSSGPLLERLGRRALLALGACAFGVGALAVSLTPPFAGLLLPFAVLGFGFGTLDAGLNGYIAGLPRSTALLNYLHAFYGGGALLGPIVASAILTAGWGWNSAYRVWAVAGGAALFAFLALFSGRPKFKTDGHEASAHASVLRAALARRVVWLSALFLFIYVGAEVSVGAWSFSLLTQTRHLPALQASWMVSGYWLGLTLGRVALGYLAGRLGTRWLVLACLAGVVAGMLAVLFAPASAFAAAGLWLTGFCFGPLFPSTIAFIDAAVPPRLQQSAIGFAASLGSMGAAVWPWLGGAIGGRLGLWTLMPYVVALSILMAAMWILLRSSSDQASAT